MYRNTWAEIDLAALRANLRALRNINPSGWMCPMLKCDAYGHGAGPIAKILQEEGISQVGVALVEEGLRLREIAGENLTILVFGFFNLEALVECFHCHLTPVLGDERSLELWCGMQTDHRPKAHLKINTGMNRVGLDLAKGPLMDRVLEATKSGWIKGFATHLASGQDWCDSEASYSARQIRRFMEIVNRVADGRQVLHALNSSALIRGGLSRRRPKHFDLLGSRPGIALYGQVPRELEGEVSIGITPVMQIKSQIGMVHEVEAGASVSYDQLFVTQRRTLVGVVPVGYGDGLTRRLTGQGRVLIDGQFAPIIGAVCMDYIMLDLTEIPEPRVGWFDTEVVWIGRQGQKSITAEEIAIATGTNSYEVLTSVSARVPRRVLKG